MNQTLKQELFIMMPEHIAEVTQLISEGFVPDDSRYEAMLYYLYQRSLGAYHNQAVDALYRQYYLIPDSDRPKPRRSRSKKA